jgi:ABC-type transport system involved in multi-copper enzyme maturation permease subunit
MFRTLWWKEWRQLRLLRWSGLGIGLLLPPFLLAMAEAGQRGWSVFGGISSYDAATVVQEALPMFLILAVWPLLALMTAAQAFVADRSAGTEAFLLQRPVRRSRIWQARAAAAIGSTGLLLAVHIAIWWICVRLLGNPAGFDEAATFARLVAQGGLGAGIALLAGASAAAFVRSPMQAMLLGLVLTAVPVALSNLLGFWYVGYSLGDVSFGYAIPLFLLAGYVVGAFRMECRGEPAGRGRLRRGLVVLAGALVAMPVFLAATAPAVMRWDARLGLGNTTVYPAPSGGVAFALNNRQGAAWLIDTASGKRLRFFAPPVSDVAWNDTGDQLAVIHAAGGSGRRLPAPRIEVFDASGSPVGRPIECDACLGWWNRGLLWAGDKIVTLAFVEGRVGVMIVDPATGERRTLSLPAGLSGTSRLIKSTEDGRVFVVWFGRSRARTADGSAVRMAVLHRVDVEAASLQEQITVPGVDGVYYVDRALSPSGRSWLRTPSEPDEQVEIVDLESGETVALPTRTAVWLSGDRLAWVEAEGAERTLMFGRPGDARPIRSFRASGTWFRSSPDRDKLLVAIRVPEDPPRLLQWVYDTAADHWQEVQTPQADPTAWFGSAQWAGPGALAFVGPGYLALQYLEHPETLEYVIGSPDS